MDVGEGFFFFSDEHARAGCESLGLGQGGGRAHNTISTMREEGGGEESESVSE